jgi:hypothetical protein
MIVDMKQLVIELEHRGVVSVEEARGARIDCLRGRIWITEHRVPGDIVLEAGESYELSRGGVAVVQALREALVALRAPTVSQTRAELAAPVHAPWSRWALRATGRQPALSARTS